MPNIKIRQSLSNTSDALTRLEEALKKPKRNKLAVDGTIQRFEFAIELLWKCFKRLLTNEGIETTTPREAIEKAFQAGWLLDEDLWLRMLKDRNETSHIYNKALANVIYIRIKKYYSQTKHVFEFLREKYRKEI